MTVIDDLQIEGVDATRIASSLFLESCAFLGIKGLLVGVIEPYSVCHGCGFSVHFFWGGYQTDCCLLQLLLELLGAHCGVGGVNVRNHLV